MTILNWIFKMRIILILFLLTFSILVNAEILYQDPQFKELNTAINQYTKEELITGLKEKDLERTYILGFLYLDGDKEKNIKRNCSKAKKLLSYSADSGIVDAEFMLATMYSHGLCVKKNLEKSRHYLESSANKGYLLSEKSLGQAYWKDQGIELYPQDMNKAIYWLSRAANHGDKESAGNLSYIYLNGINGVDKNDKKAFEWKYKSAHSSKYFDGDGSNFPEFAKFYEKGIGTDKDLVQAYKYYTLSGSAGSEGKHRVAKEMTPEQIEEGQRLAREWMDKHGVYVPSY